MPTMPFKVKAVFEYRSDEPDDLNFDNGQIITVIDDDDADWYTGEYVNASGEKVEGIFPRNFVEKYEPAVPTRPVRASKRTTAQELSEAAADVPAPQPAVPAAEPWKEAEIESPRQPPQLPEEEGNAVAEPTTWSPVPRPASPPKSPAAVSKPTASKPPPPVAEKPTSSSFRDRIAAFNKPAAAPIAPFKPGGSNSSSFIRKPFVAPPPSKNAYVPPPREPPPQRIYRREEDPSFTSHEERESTDAGLPQDHTPTEEQPKPTSLKDRIALLQKQQLEQAARHAEKKDKPKRPPKKRLEADDVEPTAPGVEPGLKRVDTNETVGRKSSDLADEEPESSSRSHLHRRPSAHVTIPPPPQPSRELVSDTNDADDSGAADTEDAQETSTEEERPRSKGTLQAVGHGSIASSAAQAEQHKDEEADTRRGQREKHEDEDEDGEGEEDEEEEEEDPEIRRRRELRDRMAKLGGGMGMMGMFGQPGGMHLPAGPRRSKPSTESSRQSTEPQTHEEAMARAPPVPIMALPGMVNALPKRQEEAPTSESDQDETAQPTPQEPAPHEDPAEDYISQPPPRRSTDRAAPPTPQEPVAAAPPPPPRESRPAPPPPPPASTRPAPPLPQSPTARSLPPPLPPPVPTRAQMEEAGEDEDQDGGEPSAIVAQEYDHDGLASPTTLPPRPPLPTLDTTEPVSFSTSEKRASRAPPPRPPMSPTTSSPQSRGPPPPPPVHPPSRRSTSDSHGFVVAKHPDSEESEEEVTEYDGDYDTDIASSAKHKDALKSHNRDSSLDEGILTDDATRPAPPPVPHASAPRDMPPPPPTQAPKSRKSTDAPRSAPPPVPLPKIPTEESDDYDPYRYSAPQHGIPSPSVRTPYSPILQSPDEEVEEDDMYGVTPQPTWIPPPPSAERQVPLPPLPVERADYPPLSNSPRQSVDVKRSATARRSTEYSRPSSEQGFIATDIDLGRASLWWMHENVPPPALQGRTDVLFEIESSTSSKRGGKTTVSRDVYVLYMDYSQTTVNATFDPSEPSHVVLEQTHARAPPAPRKDQLEQASEAYGAPIARAAAGALGSTLGDGSGQALVLELLKPLTTALSPVGTRAYGALVYANLANASTQQFDEIRPGDIVTFRNAKFSGHKGGLHAKYSMDVGKPEHVGVVIDWDGTKKKIRAWEQGREERGKKAKVREESFKVGDLKSGEVRVWRVMPRSWVGWDKS